MPRWNLYRGKSPCGETREYLTVLVFELLPTPVTNSTNNKLGQAKGDGLQGSATNYDKGPTNLVSASQANFQAIP